jgi:CRP/FNR family transcriptional regulator, anaerobic regulatory protein
MIMPTRILNSVGTFVSLTQEEKYAFMNIIEYRELEKNELILQKGQVCNFVIFIISGCLKYFYHQDEEEIIVQFFSENDWYTDYESFLSGEGSTDNVEATEDSVCLVLSKTNLENLYVNYPKFERLGRVMAEKALLGAQRCNKVSNILSPDEDYLVFFENGLNTNEANIVLASTTRIVAYESVNV